MRRFFRKFHHQRV